MVVLGVFVLLYNGNIDQETQVVWSSQGWDSLDEWRNLLIGFGFLTGGLGFILSRFIDRVKAFNIAAHHALGVPVISVRLRYGQLGKRNHRSLY